MRSKSSFKTELYLRVIIGPRGGQLGREKRRGKFSIMGERAPGMLLRTNQFHKSFKCLSLIFLCAQSEASIYHAAFMMFLYRGVYLQTRLFIVPVWLMQESSQEKLKMIFFFGGGGVGGGKQSTRIFSPSHCFPWFFNIVVLLPKNSHDSKTYFNLKSGTKVFCRLSLRLPLQCFI